MKPLRMCMVCRKRREKAELIRIVRTPEGAEIDSDGKKSGRGAYICRNKACAEQAQKRRCLERAFSRQIDSSVYETLRRETEEEADES